MSSRQMRARILLNVSKGAKEPGIRWRGVVFSGDGHHCRGRAGCYEDSNFAENYSSRCEHYYDQDELLLEKKDYKRVDPLSVYDPSRPRTVRLEGVTTDDSVKTVDVGVQTDPVYLNQFSVHLQKLKIKFISNSYVKMMILHLASRYMLPSSICYRL